MAAFLANELLPLLCGNWPASANQINANANGTAMAFGLVLRGFSAAQIRSAVAMMADDPEREFAPRPAEVKAEILKGAPAATVSESGPCVSIRACEMMAVVRVSRREQTVPASTVAKELQQVLAEKSRQGVTVTGKVV
ncbi:hypothetical protein [Aeromonas intestinalis]